MHDEAPSHEDTDWPQIAALYGLLERMSDNPMVTLNRAIAVAMVQGPAAGLELLDALAADGRLANTTGSTPCADTSSNWPATATRRSRPTWRPPTGRPTARNATICSPRRPRCAKRR